jgi:hypothetical protein
MERPLTDLNSICHHTRRPLSLCEIRLPSLHDTGPQEREVGGAPPFNFLDSTGAATIDDIEDGEPVLAANEKVF